MVLLLFLLARFLPNWEGQGKIVGSPLSVNLRRKTPFSTPDRPTSVILVISSRDIFVRVVVKGGDGGARGWGQANFSLHFIIVQDKVACLGVGGGKSS